MKKTVEKQIHSRKITTPNAIYNILGTVWRLFMYKQYNVHYTFKKDFRKEPGPYFFISNHASRLDYIFTGVPLLPVPCICALCQFCDPFCQRPGGCQRLLSGISGGSHLHQQGTGT